MKLTCGSWTEAGSALVSRGHFFAAAAEAMRRILVENARRKARIKHGGDLHRVELGESDLAITDTPTKLLGPGRGAGALPERPYGRPNW